MQFQVPQFIDVEDKIVGPFTIRQFFLLAGAALIAFLLFFVLELWLWFIITIFIVAAGAALTLGKVNGRPMSTFLKSIFNYYWRPQTYIWHPREPETQTISVPQMPRSSVTVTAKNSLKVLLNKLNTAKAALTQREKPPKISLEAPKQESLEEQRKKIQELLTQKEKTRRVNYR